MKRKIVITLCLMLILILNSAAQTYDLQFNVVNSNETNFDIQVQIKSSSEFKLAASNIVFNFNDSAINDPVLLSAENYSGIGGSPLHIYSNMTVTKPNSGITSVNIIYLQDNDEHASNVSTSWTNVGTVRYNIVDRNSTPNLVFRTSGISPTTIYKIEGSTLTLLSGGDLVTYNSPLPVELTFFIASVNNNSVNLNWSTATEVNNYGFDVERRVENGIGKTCPPARQVENGKWKQIGFVEGHGSSNSPREYSFTDENLKPENYQYRLKQIDNDGLFKYSKVIEASIEDIPVQLVLEQNYPNPFNPVTKIKYSIPSVGTSLLKFVQLKVYDILGREVAALVNEEKPDGLNEVQFNATGLSSGLYIYRLFCDGQVISMKMNLLK